MPLDTPGWIPLQNGYYINPNSREIVNGPGARYDKEKTTMYVSLGLGVYWVSSKMDCSYEEAVDRINKGEHV